MPDPSEGFAFLSYSKKAAQLSEQAALASDTELMQGRTSMVRMSGTTGEHTYRMLKKPVQQGRSE
jgi:hypothetical protein